MKKLEDKSILIVEDDDCTFLLLTFILEESNVKIKRAINGMEVLDLIHQENFDLILMDINLPMMKGDKVVEILRKENNKTPIIAETACVIRGKYKEFNADEFNEVIFKPFRVEAIQTIVEKYLG